MYNHYLRQLADAGTSNPVSEMEFDEHCPIDLKVEIDHSANTGPIMTRNVGVQTSDVIMVDQSTQIFLK